MTKTTPKEEIRKFKLTDDEFTKFKRLLNTIGFFNTAVESMQTDLQVTQAMIENRVAVGQAPEGYKYQTKIDMETKELHVKKVKDEPQA